jgi:hypothetical protein
MHNKKKLFFSARPRLRNPEIGEKSVVAYPVSDLDHMHKIHLSALHQELG